jgi:hypothetical protein
MPTPQNILERPKKMFNLYGHVLRRQYNRWPERIMSWLPEGSGLLGRSEIRWEKAVEREMKQRNLTYDNSLIWQIWRLELGNSWNNGKVKWYVNTERQTERQIRYTTSKEFK